MFTKKSIVLSSVDKSNKKAVLTLQQEKFGLAGMLRLYNFSHEPQGICSLGMCVENSVFKAGLTLKSRMLYQFFLDVQEIPNKFSVAVVNFQNGDATPILFGSSEGSVDEVYASIIGEISEKTNLAETQKVLDKYGVEFDEEEKQEVEKEIDKALCGNDCANCIYKKYFFEHSEQSLPQEESEKPEVFAEKSEPKILQTETEELKKQPKETKKQEKNIENEQNFQEKDEILEKNSKNEEQDLFYNRLRPQIDKLFENNPAEKNLQSLIPSSKWVKVEYEDDGDFYVFGLLFDASGQVRYVCYGVPAVFNEKPPEELSGYPTWLPLKDEKGFGYWLTYQDASTGQPVKAVIE